MGDGKKLKEHINNKGTNVRKIAKETGISAATLYTIIQKDSIIRFDFALRLANALDIDVNEICSASPFSGAITEEEIYPSRWIERCFGCQQSKNLLKELSLSVYAPIWQEQYAGCGQSAHFLLSDG